MDLVVVEVSGIGCVAQKQRLLKLVDIKIAQRYNLFMVVIPTV
jgi:hypothetical protein